MRWMIGAGATPPALATVALPMLVMLGAESLSAQACIGYPQRRDGAVSATFSFPEGGTGYDLSGMVASQDADVFFEGGFGIVAPDEEALENVKHVHGTAAYQVEALAPDASICPAVGVSYSWVGDLNTWTIPFGIGVGATVPLGRRGRSGLTPFAIPQFLYIRDSIDDVDDSAASDVFVALQAGLTLHVGAFRITGGVSKIFEEDRDAVFALGVGAAWR